MPSGVSTWGRNIVARAPTRIDFGGGWTDVPPYSEECGGSVCNLAIARHATVRLAPLPGRVRVTSGATTAEAAEARELPAHGEVALGAGALRCAGASGISISLASDFPPGAGLGGSSAAGVALAAALARWKGDLPDRSELAERSRKTEVEELGVAGGRQDHYAAAHGGALALRFSSTGVEVTSLPLPAPLRAELERRCIVAYTGESRISGGTITAVLDAYRAREPRVTAALARMAALAGEMASALAAADLDALGALVREHWVHQRALHPRITTPAIDAVLDAAIAAGALGGKALGASGGGCVLAIAPEHRVEDVRAAVARTAELLAFEVDSSGVRVEQADSRVEQADSPADGDATVTAWRS